MAKIDLSDYEIRRAEDHEIACRLAASLAHIDHRVCHYRMCRRHLVCCGPMLPSEHQAMRVRAQKEIGLSGAACAKLPRCIAHAETGYYDAFRTVMRELEETRREMGDEGTLSMIRKVIYRSHRQKHTDPAATCLLTSEPYHPTSDPGTKGSKP